MVRRLLSLEVLNKRNKLIKGIISIFFVLILFSSLIPFAAFALNDIQIENLFKVEKYYVGNLTTGQNIKIGYRFFNNLNQSVKVIIQDKNIIENTGIDVACLELTIPKNESSYVLEQSMVLTKSGKFTLPSANITVFFNDKEYNISTNNLSLEIKGNDIQGNFITSIYQCNGIKKISSNYATSSTYIRINNGNVYIGNELPEELNEMNPFNEIEEIDQYIDKQVEEMHRRIQQIMNTFFPQQQMPQYTPVISPSQTGNQSTNTQRNPETNETEDNSITQANQSIKSSAQKIKRIPQAQKPDNSIINKIVNRDSRIRHLLPWIKFLILLIILGLIIALIKLSKVQPYELEDVETSGAIELYKEIKSKLKRIKRIKSQEKVKNRKDEILRFKEKVAEFKDALIEEFEEVLENDIIDNIDLYLYADEFSSLEYAIKKLDEVFIQK